MVTSNFYEYLEYLKYELSKYDSPECRYFLFRLNSYVRCTYETRIELDVIQKYLEREYDIHIMHYGIFNRYKEGYLKDLSIDDNWNREGIFKSKIKEYSDYLISIISDIEILNKSFIIKRINSFDESNHSMSEMKDICELLSNNYKLSFKSYSDFTLGK